MNLKSFPHDSQQEISSSYIFKVHYLIERCLLLYMDEKETIEALRKQNIQPEITVIVWRELVKANEEFFTQYFRTRQDKRRPAESSSSTNSILIDGSLDDDLSSDVQR